MQERSKEQLNNFIRDSQKNFGIDWDHSKDLAEREAKIEQIGYNKAVVLKTLLGFSNQNQAFNSEVGLHQLFKKYFSTLVDKEFTNEDLEQLKNLHPNLKEISRHMPVVKVKKGYYQDSAIKKTSCILWSSLVISEISGITLVGASGVNKAVWFFFDKNDSDVNRGYVYVRRTPYSKLQLLSTFEINPFIRGNTLVTNKETGESEEKYKITFNPAWLTATLENMEKYVFKTVL